MSIAGVGRHPKGLRVKTPVVILTSRWVREGGWCQARRVERRDGASLSMGGGVVSNPCLCGKMRVRK